MGEITLDLRLVIKIPSSKLTINGLVLGLKQSAPQIHAAILTTLLEALEEKVVERYLEKDPQRYRKNGHQSKPRKFSCSLVRLLVSVRPADGPSKWPQPDAPGQSAFDPGAGAVFGRGP